MSRTQRLLSIGAVAAIATVGPVVFSAPARAADANSKVWVCKYVRTPGGDEVLKAGKNPIEVSGKSVDKDKDGQVYVGDQFADAQERSVVVQIEGTDPGPGICLPLRGDSDGHFDGHPSTATSTATRRPLDGHSDGHSDEDSDEPRRPLR